MARFKEKNKRSATVISTASLPDIVFMLLFFFMVATVMRQDNLLVKIKLPEATEIKKLERRSLVSHIYVGEPKNSVIGNQPRIQINDAFVEVDRLDNIIPGLIATYPENDRSLVTISLKIDQFVKMGIITDLKLALRKSNALKINYASRRFCSIQ